MKKCLRLFSGQIFLLILAIYINHSCQHEPVDISYLNTICFEALVLPIFQNSCGISGCHAMTGSAEEQVFVDYSSIMRVVVPFDPRGSSAYNVLISTGEHHMPPGHALAVESRTLIRIWIEQGAENTRCPDITDGGANGSNGSDTTGTLAVCFERDILPVLASSCGIAGCHDAITATGEKILTNYASIAGNPDLVRPYQPLESNLIKVVKLLRNDEDAMPPSPYDPLSQTQIDSIYNWIAKGALDEDCRYLCDTVDPVSYSGDIVPIIQNNCLGCHSGASPEGGISLESYSNVLTVANNGKLMPAVNRTGPSPMPPAFSLSGCLIRIIEMWITEGALNN